MGKNAQFVTQMDRQITGWDKEVDALGRKSGNGAAHVGAAYDAGLKELREARDAARVAFQEIRFASEAEGLELKPAMQAAWMRMQSALEEVNAALARSKTPGSA